MKQMGRTHRHYYRIVAIDARQPRDGRVIEELGTYDPHVAGQGQAGHPASRRGSSTGRASGPSRPSTCAAIFKKYMKKFEELEAKQAAAKAAAATPPAQAGANAG